MSDSTPPAVSREAEILRLQREIVDGFVAGRFTFEAFNVILVSALRLAEAPYRDEAVSLATADRALDRLRKAAEEVRQK